MNNLHRLLLLVFCIVAIPAFGQSLDELILERIEAGETPSMVIAIHQNGKTTYHAQGFSNVETKKSADSKTLYEIGSITKTFTTTAVAQLAQEGKIKLTDPAQQYLPPGVTLPVRGDKVITIEDLASARSGLPRMPDNFKPADESNPYLDYTEEQLYAFLKGCTLSRDIGSQYEYSNLGMGLLGVLVSRLDQRPYRESIEQRILKPLKMKSTFLNTPGREDKNAAVGYSDGKQVSAWTWNDGSCMQGAGGLLSNAEDMMIYLLANMNPPGNSLGLAMKDAHQPRMDIGRNNMKIGLGWHLRNKIVWHNGGTGGFRTFAGYEPEKKMAIVILTNSTVGADDLGFHLMDESIPLKKIRKPVAVAQSILQSYTGTYEITPQFQIAISEEGGQLMAQATNQPKFNLYPESATKFFLKVVDAQVEFIKNEQGVVDKLILYQNGAALAGIRKP
jgi:D-alanyl-D-alanine-carboxypeptidase/D-alanyl-D-alanine-endopeptidase